MAAGMALTAICNVLRRINELGAKPLVHGEGDGGGQVEVDGVGNPEVDADGFAVNTFTKDNMTNLANFWRYSDHVNGVGINNNVIYITTVKNINFRFEINLGTGQCEFRVILLLIAGTTHEFAARLTCFEEMIDVSDAAYIVFVRDWKQWKKDTPVEPDSEYTPVEPVETIETHAMTYAGISPRELSFLIDLDRNHNYLISIKIEGCDQSYYSSVGSVELLMELVQHITDLRQKHWVSV
jgi:hypothetical protein